MLESKWNVEIDRFWTDGRLPSKLHDSWWQSSIGTPPAQKNCYIIRLATGNSLCNEKTRDTNLLQR